MIPTLFTIVYRAVRLYKLPLPSFMPEIIPIEMARENGEYVYYIERMKNPGPYFRPSKNPASLKILSVENLLWKGCVVGDIGFLVHIWETYKPPRDLIDKTLSDLIWHLHVDTFIRFHRYLDFPALSFECMSSCAFPRRFMNITGEDRDSRVSDIISYLSSQGIFLDSRANRLATFCGNISYVEHLRSMFPQEITVQMRKNVLSKGHRECAIILECDESEIKTGYSLTGGVASMLLRVRERSLNSYNIALGFLDF